MYAIRDKLTKKWIYGTDYSGRYPIQRTSFEKALIFDNIDDVEYEFKKRRCNESVYEIVEVELAVKGGE